MSVNIQAIIRAYLIGTAIGLMCAGGLLAFIIIRG
ncbi:hypothetical protein ACVISU_008162 [Bradyrhizobium sp. USDA 4452]